MPKREKNEWANQMVAVHNAIRLLSRPQGASNEELEEELGVKKRSVQRLKRTLDQQFHLPQEEVHGIAGKSRRWKIMDTASITIPNVKKIGLDPSELLALYILRGVAGIYKGSAIMDDINGAFEKIGTNMSPESRKMLEKYSRMFVVAPKSAKNYAASDGVIEELSYAIIGQKTCKVTYHAYGEDVLKTYTINPLHFFEHDGGLYLIAVITKYGDLRTLAVERLKEVEETKDHFEYPVDFDPERYLSSAFTLYFGEPETFKIRFPKDQARYISERIWAVDQKIETRKDGSLILTMTTSGGYDIKKWVLSYGGDAELLEPQWLRDEIVEEMKRSLKKYQGKK
jgi:predicted DNA-binding transcriptional regulator YafY